MNKKTVSVVIPAYNASKSIEAVIHSIPEWIDQIIVVDDNSNDRTAQIIENLENPRLTLVQHEKNLGVGGAVKTGYCKAIKMGCDVIVKLDSDGQMDPYYIPLLVNPIINSTADYCKGNRFLHSQDLMRMPKIRRIGNIGLSFLTKAASGYWNIFDPTNGYTAISAQVIRTLNFKNLANRFFFETSMLIELYLSRAVVKDISIPAIYKDEQSHLSETKSFFEFSLKLIKGFFKRIKITYFLMDFNAVSALLLFGSVGCLFGIVWGILNWIISAQTGTPASTGTIMLSVVPVILGFQFLLQALMIDTQNIPKEVITRSNEMAAIKTMNKNERD